MDTMPDISDFQSLLGSSGTWSRQPSLRSRAVDDGAISNQTIAYPGDTRVIAPSRSNSLRRTASMTDLGEEFESALRQAKDARPGFGFGLGLVGAILGEGSHVTVSSGPTLGCDIIVTPPVLVAVVDLVLDLYARSPQLQWDEFFSSGARSSVGQSTFHSVSSAQSGVLVTMLAMGTPAILTVESSGPSFQERLGYAPPLRRTPSEG